MRTVTASGLLLLGFTISLAAQPAPGHLAKVRALNLHSVKDGDTVAYYSKDRKARGQVFLKLIRGMVDFYASERGWRLTPLLAVLNEEDWRATMENPYGVPGVRRPGPIAFVPADVEKGATHRDIVALWGGVSPELKREVEKECGSIERCAADGADLIITHELGHAYARDAMFATPGEWVNEFVADYLSYAYLRERQPKALVRYLLIHRAFAFSRPQFKNLGEWEKGYEHIETPEMGRVHAMLIEHIQELYARQGLGFFDKLVAAFPRQEHPTGCFPFAPSLCQSQFLPNDEMERRFEAIDPGFAAWAANFGKPRP